MQYKSSSKDLSIKSLYTQNPLIFTIVISYRIYSQVKEGIRKLPAGTVIMDQLLPAAVWTGQFESHLLLKAGSENTDFVNAALWSESIKKPVI